MTKLRTVPWLLLLFVIVPGCGSGNGEPVVEVKPAAATILPDKDSLDLKDLLSRPRQELARLADECREKFAAQELRQLDHQIAFVDASLCLPLVVPVLREAKYVSELGFSLPPYATANDKDSALALHLARHGDVDAASKLVDPKDTAALAQIKGLRFDRAYPLEWTRLVGLHLHFAQWQLATGNFDGGKQLVSLHRQLEALLAADASPAPLRTQLLPVGRRILAQLAAHWSGTPHDAIAREAESLVAKWKTQPAFLTGHPGTTLAEVAAWLNPQATPKGKAVPASSPLRALDLLGLPLEHAHAEAAVACFDAQGKITELVITYASDVQHYQKPVRMAHFLEERAPGLVSDVNDSLPRSVYRGADAACEIALVPNNPAAGAVVRLEYQEQPRPIVLDRSFGTVSLDRTFERNRLKAALQGRGNVLAVSQPKLLTSPLGTSIAQATMIREKEHDLLARFLIEYGRDTGAVPLAKVALPLWERGGAARIRSSGNGSGDHLQLVWDDGSTRHVLAFPNQRQQSVKLLVENTPAPDALGKRLSRALVLDAAERRDRLQKQVAEARLPRALEQVRLGMTRQDLARAVPLTPTLLQRELPGSTTFIFTGEPDPKAEWFAREFMARWGDGDKVVEVRARYHEGKAGGGKGLTRLLDSLKARGGAARSSTEKSTVWADLFPTKANVSVQRWHDDVSLLTARLDSSGIELVLRDCPLEHAEGAPVPDLQVLPRGPDKCLLGASRAELMRGFDVKQAIDVDGALVLPVPATSPFDGIVVWFDKDKAVRIVARHKGLVDHSSKASLRVRETWGRELQRFGWPWRQQLTSLKEVQTCGTHDDYTRLRIFWQQEPGGIAVLSEWKDLRP